MSTELLIALVGVFSTVVSSTTSWLLAKRKYNVEVDTNEIKNLKESLEFYRKIVQDYTNKLQFYIDLSEGNTREVYRLKGIIHRIVNNACLKTCSVRESYTEEELKEIFGELNLPELNGDSSK